MGAALAGPGAGLSMVPPAAGRLPAPGCRLPLLSGDGQAHPRRGRRATRTSCASSPSARATRVGSSGPPRSATTRRGRGRAGGALRRPAPRARAPQRGDGHRRPRPAGRATTARTRAWAGGSRGSSTSAAPGSSSWSTPTAWRYDLTRLALPLLAQEPPADARARGHVGTDLNRNYGYRFGCCGASSGAPGALELPRAAGLVGARDAGHARLRPEPRGGRPAAHPHAHLLPHRGRAGPLALRLHARATCPRT